jgi:hypothetical protein
MITVSDVLGQGHGDKTVQFIRLHKVATLPGDTGEIMEI